MSKQRMPELLSKRYKEAQEELDRAIENQSLELSQILKNFYKDTGVAVVNVEVNYDKEEGSFDVVITGYDLKELP